jgi:hypothetical protein
MRIRRTFPVVLAVIIVAAAVTAAVQLRKHAPPEAARLLPAADAFLYADLSWIRKISSAPLPPVSRDPEYDQFVQQTGFQFERDLDSAAFAVHYPEKVPGGPREPEMRFSEVFVGKFNGERLAAYLKHMARSVENYKSVDIYTIPLDGRTFRVAVLSVDCVAASNQDDPGVIRGMVDRSRRLASPFGGPAFLRHYYKWVQLASPVWLVAHVNPSSSPFRGWSSLLSHPADLVVSASYNLLHLPLRTGVLRLRAEAWTKTEDDARNLTDKANAFLANFHAAEMSVRQPASDADLKTVFDSLELRQEDSRAILSATLPTSLFRKMLAPPDQSGSPAPAPASAQGLKRP